MKFADVIVPLAVEGFYTYSVPAELENEIGEGKLVIVPFAGNKKYTGLVWRVHGTEPSGYKIRAIESVIEREICFSGRHLRFLLWVSEYYMATPGDVLRAALPVAFRLESFTCITLSEKKIDYGELTFNEQTVLNFLQAGQYTAVKDIEVFLHVKDATGLVKSLLNKGYVQVKETIDEVFREKTERVVKWRRFIEEPEMGKILDSLKRAPVQYKMLCKWIELQQPELEKSKFLSGVGNSVAALNALCEKNILCIEERKISRLQVEEYIEREGNELSVQQRKAFKEIKETFARKDTVLLQGVTSSGKTEVYIHLIKDFIRQGKQVLYMLPEIALTVQIIKRLKKVFGETIGVYHSGMPDNIRAELWKKQCSEHPYALILGVRSSVFLPFRNLGLIIVDEEHDGSYKQKEPAPRYNARDTAIMLGKIYNARILLGSATPSFESYENVKTGKYGWVKLLQRYGNIQMPELIFADIKEARRKKIMKGSFTPFLYERMKAALENGKQIILFQNRRGYSTYLQCDCCGATLKCDHCDVSMTYYKQRELLSCRYCGSLKKVTDVCVTCGQGHYKMCTPGTEKIEEEVETLFPGVKTARMDLDIMSSKAKYHAVIEDFEQGKTQILIGTQMVSKGLDFENVKLVGVIDADSMVNFPDFRAEERAYCMLMQVSGRSGRKGEQGEVIIQSADLENRIYTLLKKGDYNAFFEELTEDRRIFGYPPFCRMIRIELRHKDIVTVRNAANQLARSLRVLLAHRVCGPAVPEISRINGMNRIHLLLKIEAEVSFSKVKSYIKTETQQLLGDKSFNGLKVVCDVDPV